MYKKRKTSWNKGLKWSNEMKQKFSEAHKGKIPWNKGKKIPEMSGENHFFWGKHRSKKTIRKISVALKGKTSPNKGKKMSEEQKNKLSKAHMGLHHTQKTKDKISKAFTGAKHPHWLGGKSYELYGVKFNKKLKEIIRKRDHYECQKCYKNQNECKSLSGLEYSLIIHHIDYNKKNNQESNLISLCRNCHAKTNHKRNYWIEYFRKILIKKYGVRTVKDNKCNK